MVSMTTRGWSSTPFRRWPGDRKSTRLNSSHANISYAVFCLKKKKEPHEVREVCADNQLSHALPHISEHPELGCPLCDRMVATLRSLGGESTLEPCHVLQRLK